MTTLQHVDSTCGVCGLASQQCIVGSTSTFGAPDLDTRPAELMRSTLPFWIQHCDACGYCAPDISRATQIARRVVASDEYRGLRRSGLPTIASRFLCWALVAEKSRRFTESGWAAVQAAWVCDDENEAVAAMECRLRALDLFRRAQAAGRRVTDDLEADAALLVDLLRRSQRFDEARAECSNALARQPRSTIEMILRFQQSLIAHRDDGAYTMADAEHEDDLAL